MLGYLCDNCHRWFPEPTHVCRAYLVLRNVKTGKTRRLDLEEVGAWNSSPPEMDLDRKVGLKCAI